MYEILCRTIPYEETGLEAMKIVLAVSRGRRPDLSRYPTKTYLDDNEDIHKGLIDIMTKCWDHLPNNRPSITEVCDKLKTYRIR